ncbi:SDR family NAD(P)-dependent oxidoreductase [Aliiglaciecola sp. LCG003]|uniref:SDR family NAD(P)-dependent oxidoreductase n=1 Tax=Aliiglaciecola sp. LCG003 TaxID=3053655 RepID=UPI002572B784|nr:SDR family NAD(P)-dependent oxidoreductase [Aliiglaciecola sp. LCG003]WJG09887.1 SDR family NAD(P)-dependent oxidoreductase [Aliiglaciecola sp. LCG003]
MSKGNALVIGCSGGIGKELLKQLLVSEQYQTVFGVSRCVVTDKVAGVNYYQLADQDENAIERCIDSLRQQGQFSLVTSCIGALHGQQNGVNLAPEKRLEDISAQQLASYFHINTIIPMLWLKHILPLVKGHNKSQVVLFSARVGSISENNLGGWYGYRASKAALNMLIKTSQIEYTRRAKNVELVSYHPGTVNTALSEPFQANVPSGKLFDVEFTVSQLLTHLANLEIENAPHYIDWQNETIKW